MTRHGTLAYYLAAWVIGCPVVALVYWLIESVQSRSASSSVFLETSFFALMAGAIDSLLFAFFLRRVMHGLGARSSFVWSFAGGALSLALVFLLAWCAGKLPGSFREGPGYFVSSFIFDGPLAVWRSGWWQAPLDGAAIGGVLALVDRAFNQGAPAESTAHPGERQAAPAGQTPV